MRESRPSGAEGPAGILAQARVTGGSPAGAERQSGQAGAVSSRPDRIAGNLAQPGYLYSSLAGNMPARVSIFRIGLLICRPGKLYSGQCTYNPAQLLFICFSISCTHNTTYTMYIRHNKGVLWYTRGYIPDTQSTQAPFCTTFLHKAFSLVQQHSNLFEETLLRKTNIYQRPKYTLMQR
jgi:hypothetical protein